MGSCCSNNDSSRVDSNKVKNLEEIKPLEKITKPITNIIQLSNGNVVFSSCADKKILEYSYSNNKLELINQFTGHGSISQCLIEIENYLISADYSDQLLVFNNSNHKLIDKYHISISIIDIATPLKNGILFLNLCNSNYALCNPKNNFSVEKNYEKISQSLSKIAANPTNSTLVYSLKDKKENNVLFYDYVKDEVVKELSIKYVMGIFFRSNGNILFPTLRFLIEVNKDDYSIVRSVEFELIGLLSYIKELINGDFVASSIKGHVNFYDSNFKLKKQITPIENYENQYFPRTLQLKDGNIIIGDDVGKIAIYDQNYELLNIVHNK